MWSEDPYLLYKDPSQSKQILNDLLRSTFKSTTKQGDLIFGQFKLDQVWEQIEHHTNKVNTRIMNRISTMIEDEDFIQQLQQNTDGSGNGDVGGVEAATVKGKKQQKVEEYKYQRDDE